MQAIQFDRYGGPDVLHRATVPVPDPGPGQVRVDLRAVAVLPVDCKIRSGALQEVFRVPLPKVPGRDGAGVVGAVAPGVDYASVGDRVCVVASQLEQGTYRQAILRTGETLVPIPPSVDDDHAAALIHSGVCAVICIRDTAEVRPGTRILVHGGAGAIGSLAIQLAKHQGAIVTATCSAANVSHALAMGADRAIAYDREDFSTLGRQFDVVLDLIGGDVHARSYQVLRTGGHMVCLRAAPFEDRAAEHGVRLTVPQIHESREVLDRVMALAGAGHLRPQVTDRLPLDQAVAAHAKMDVGAVSRGRIVLRVPPLASGTASPGLRGAASG